MHFSIQLFEKSLNQTGKPDVMPIPDVKYGTYISVGTGMPASAPLPLPHAPPQLRRAPAAVRLRPASVRSRGRRHRPTGRPARAHWIESVRPASVEG